MMKTLWTNISGTEESRRLLNLKKLPYPLCFNMPNASWTENSNTIKLLNRDNIGLLFIDIVFEYQKLMDDINFKFCVGVSDKSFINTIVNPTVRDKGVCYYYSRWPKEYNLISDTFVKGYSNLLESNISFSINKKKKMITPQFDHSPLQIVKFFSNFSTINEGDLISLGSKEIVDINSIVPKDVKIEVGNYFKWEIHISN